MGIVEEDFFYPFFFFLTSKTALIQSQDHFFVDFFEIQVIRAKKRQIFNFSNQSCLGGESRSPRQDFEKWKQTSSFNFAVRSLILIIFFRNTIKKTIRNGAF